MMVTSMIEEDSYGRGWRSHWRIERGQVLISTVLNVRATSQVVIIIKLDAKRLGGVSFRC